jgi:hypothetical protein
MNSRAIVPTATAPAQPTLGGSVGAVAVIGRNRPNIRTPQRVSDTKPQQAQPKAILINAAQTMQTGCKPSRRKQLVVDHAPCQTVAPCAHAARGNGLKTKAENNHKERKPAAPFTTLYSAFNTDNVAKSAAKQPAPHYRSVVMRKGLQRNSALKVDWNEKPDPLGFAGNEQKKNSITIMLDKTSHKRLHLA